MAVVVSIPEKKQSPAAMKGVIAYCCQAEKTRLDERTVLVSGRNCMPDSAFQSFFATQKLQDCKPGQVRFFHYVQSFRAEDNLSTQQAHEIGLQLAEYFGNHETVVATHLDNGQLHNHFVVNAYDFAGGNKLHMNKGTLKEMRDLSDKLCVKYGISVLRSYNDQDPSTNLGAREYRAAVKGESWKFQLMASIEDAMKRSGDRDEFYRLMRKRGYEITWTAERKYITYTCPNGMKCRDIKLHDRKYTKEEMEYEFGIRKQIAGQLRTEQVGAGQRSVHTEDRDHAVSAHRLRHPGGTADGGIEFASAGGSVPADPVPADFAAGNLAYHQRTLQGDSECGSGIYELDGGSVDQCQPANGAENAGERLTGWEEAREFYFRSREAAPEQYTVGGESYSESRGAPAEDYALDSGHLSPVVGLGLRGILEAGSVIEDTSEDPEERRKRIEADQAGANLGTVLGLAIGVVSALADQTGQDSPSQEETEENEEQAMGGM